MESKVMTYREKDIFVDGNGEFFVREEGAKIVRRDTLESVKEWLDKQSKIKFERVSIIRLSPRWTYGMREEGKMKPVFGQVTSVTPNGDYWTSCGGEREKGGGFSNEILDTPGNRKLAEEFFDLAKKIVSLKKDQEKIREKMERWFPPKSAS